MKWYVAYSLSQPAAPGRRARECRFFVRAEDSSAAYDRAREIGRSRAESDQMHFAGISDLLETNSEPADEEEILWRESEMSEAAIENCLRPKSAMQAFRPGTSRSGWYVAQVLLREIHDEGSHGPRRLVWINSYLLAADGAETAYKKAVTIGRAYESPVGSHRCGGEKAHWQFAGLCDLIAAAEAPADGSLLWCGAVGSRRTVPPRSQLAVFRWEARRSRSHGLALTRSSAVRG